LSGLTSRPTSFLLTDVQRSEAERGTQSVPSQECFLLREPSFLRVFLFEMRLRGWGRVSLLDRRKYRLERLSRVARHEQASSFSLQGFFFMTFTLQGRYINIGDHLRWKPMLLGAAVVLRCPPGNRFSLVSLALELGLRISGCRKSCRTSLRPPFLAIVSITDPWAPSCYHFFEGLERFSKAESPRLRALLLPSFFARYPVFPVI